MDGLGNAGADLANDKSPDKPRHVGDNSDFVDLRRKASRDLWLEASRPFRCLRPRCLRKANYEHRVTGRVVAGQLEMPAGERLDPRLGYRRAADGRAHEKRHAPMDTHAQRLPAPDSWSSCVLGLSSRPLEPRCKTSESVGC